MKNLPIMFNEPTLSAPNLDFRQALLPGLMKNNPAGRLNVSALTGKTKKKKGFFETLFSSFEELGGENDGEGSESSTRPPAKKDKSKLDEIRELAQADDDATARMLEDYRESLNTPSFDFNPKQSYRFPGFFNG
jgi:hypothetical protein